MCVAVFFFFKQKTAYEMRISDWSSDVCSSDLRRRAHRSRQPGAGFPVSLRSRATDRPQAVRRDPRTRRYAGRIVSAPRRGIARRAAVRDAFAVPQGRLAAMPPRAGDRKSGVQGKSVSVRVDLGGRRILKKKKQNKAT